MAIIDSYRKSAFLQNEQGSHLDQWRTESYWKSVQSASGAKQAPKIWSHYVLEPPERALDYLDWLNHRHPRLPYPLRRLLLPAWLLVPLLRSIGQQQISRITRFEVNHTFQLQQYAIKAYVWRYKLQACLDQNAVSLPLMRAIRLNSEWIRARERLIQASIEKVDIEAGAVPEPIEVRATPWQNPGTGTWKVKKVIRELLALQEQADNEMFIVVSDPRGAALDQTSIEQAAYPLLGLNPRKSSSHYVFSSAKQGIEHLHSLNHRFPKFPYLARRALLPIKLLTRFIQRIGNHQRSAILDLSKLPSPTIESYLERAEERGQQLNSCIEQNPLSIPLMKAIRLNCEWLRDRQQTLDSLVEQNAESKTQIEVRATPWMSDEGEALTTQAVLKILLSLQKTIDKELGRVRE